MIFRFFVYGIVIVILSDIPNNFGIVYYGAYAVIGFLMLSICILPFRTALTLLLMLAIAGGVSRVSEDSAKGSVVFLRNLF